MMRLSQAAAALGCRFSGKDVLFTSVGSDSRNIVDGQLFVALSGPRFDGHAYAADALASGAAAVMLVADHPTTAQLQDVSALLVQDTRLALGQLAAWWRAQFDIPVVAITGSNGKTTVKEMLTSIMLHAHGADAVLATIGNLNNDIGMPMTLLRLRQQHRAAVIELGMNHLGEIAYLTEICQPTVGLVNNAGVAHIGELGSRQAIAKAKGELFERLPQDAIAVINLDDQFADYWLTCLSGQPSFTAADPPAIKRTITFSLTGQADVSTSVTDKPVHQDEMLIHTANQTFNVRLRVPGQHNQRNALAATAAALALGTPITAIQQGLANFHGTAGRLQTRSGLNGCTVFDDSYNANPDSMHAAIDVLVRAAIERGQSLLTLFVMGDMGELGADAANMHAEIGSYAKKAGIQQLFAIGPLSAHAVSTFGAGGQHYPTASSLLAELLPKLDQHCLVLVKASRFMHMEEIVNQIVTDQSEAEMTGQLH